MTNRTFLLPSLAVAQRLPPVLEMLDDFSSQALALGLLQDTVQRWSQDNRQTYLVVLPGFSQDLAGALHTTGGFGGTPQYLDVYPLRERMPGRVHIPPGATVVLATGVIVSGFTVDRAITILRKQGFHPAAVLTLFDLRPPTDEGGRNSLHPPPPVLVGVKMPEALRLDGEPLRDDVVLHNPGDRHYHERTDLVKPAFSSDDFFHLAIQAEAPARLGHFQVRTDRHVSALMDMNWMLDRSTPLREAIEQRVLDWVNLQSARIPLTVYYPDDQSGYARDVASVVALTLEGHGVEADCSPLSRSMFDHSRIYCDEPLAPSPRAAVLVDWGAVTARTIRNASSAIVDRGYERLLVLLLTSQLPATERDTLARVSTLRAHIPPLEASDTLFSLEPATLPVWGACAVTFEVIADLPLPTEQRTACWSCSALGELLKLEKAVPSTGLWRHAQRKSKQYVLQENARDALTRPLSLFNIEVSSAEVARALRVRASLARALDDRRLAHDLRGEIDSEDPERPGQMGQALLLLLLVEPDWLKDLPLAIPSVRRKLGKLCVSTIRGRPGGGISKWAAAALLRGVSKEIFLDCFALLFMDCREPDVRWELILGMHTLSSRPYHQTQGVQSRIAAACLDAQAQILPHEDESGPMIDSLQRMERSARSRERAATRPTMQSAWQSLRRDYKALFARHPAIAGDALIVVDALDGPSSSAQALRGGSPKPPDGWDSVRASWRNCSDYLATQVVPSLSFVRPVIDVYLDMENSLAMRRRGEVLLDSHEMSLLKLQTLDRGMEALESDTLTEQDRKELANLFRDWFASVLEAPVGRGPNGDAEDAAYLYRALERCPASVEKVWTEARARLVAEGTEPVFTGASIPAQMVFCDRMVLRDALVHVMENVYSPRHRGRRQEKRVIEVSHKAANGELVLEIKNTGTEEAEYPGQGMARFDGLLKNFGASLKGSPSDGRPFTYVATLILPLWNGILEEDDEDADYR